MTAPIWRLLAMYHKFLEKEESEGHAVVGTYRYLSDLRQGILYRRVDYVYFLFATQKPVKEDLLYLLRKVEYDTVATAVPVLIAEEVTPGLEKAAEIMGIQVVRAPPPAVKPPVQCAIDGGCGSECVSHGDHPPELTLCQHCLLPFLTFPRIHERLQARLRRGPIPRGLLCPRCFSKAEMPHGFVFGGTILSGLQFLVEEGDITRDDLVEITGPKHLPYFATLLNKGNFPAVPSPLPEKAAELGRELDRTPDGPWCSFSDPILVGEAPWTGGFPLGTPSGPAREARTIDLEMACFSMAESTGTLRMLGEPPLEYLMRVLIELTGETDPHPSRESQERAVSRTLLEAYANTTGDLQEALTRALEEELWKWAERARIQRLEGESAFDYIRRIKGSLEVHSAQRSARSQVSGPDPRSAKRPLGREHLCTSGSPDSTRPTSQPFAETLIPASPISGRKSSSPSSNGSSRLRPISTQAGSSKTDAPPPAAVPPHGPPEYLHKRSMPSERKARTRRRRAGI